MTFVYFVVVVVVVLFFSIVRGASNQSRQQGQKAQHCQSQPLQTSPRSFSDGRLLQAFNGAHDAWDVISEFLSISDFYSVAQTCKYLTDSLAVRGPLVLHLGSGARSRLSHFEVARIVGWSGLWELDLSHCESLTDASAWFLSRMPLRGLKLSCCNGLTNVGLSMLCGMSTLKDVTLDFNPKIGLAAIHSLSRLQLTSLSMRGCGLTDDHMSTLFGRRTAFRMSLRVLELSENSVSDSSLPRIIGCRRLQELGLSQCDISDEGLATMSSLCELTVLRLAKTRITDNALTSLQLPLKELVLHGCREVTSSGVLQLVTPKLHKLDVCNTQVDSSLIRSVAEKAPELEELKLSGCRVDDEALKEIAKLCSLRVLDLSSCSSVSCRGMTLLSKSTSPLHTLDISFTAVKDNGLKHLQYSFVESLRKMSLRFLTVSDEGLRTFRAHRLSHLDASACSDIQGHGILCLQLESLKALDLRWLELSPAVESRIKSAVPHAQLGSPALFSAGMLRAVQRMRGLGENLTGAAAQEAVAALTIDIPEVMQMNSTPTFGLSSQRIPSPVNWQYPRGTVRRRISRARRGTVRRTRITT